MIITVAQQRSMVETTAICAQSFQVETSCWPSYIFINTLNTVKTPFDVETMVCTMTCHKLCTTVKPQSRQYQ